ncbi:A disintegrin and metalloproteinase with thrombospondin motifs 6-like [Asterias amurensis]|uniref:A disintegrin and metalloproteinase with thrombospondin motifs 6-like n=1 Tax=Asterias amurensis TaxID=7602 RepID=UPI003AB6FE88
MEAMERVNSPEQHYYAADDRIQFHLNDVEDVPSTTYGVTANSLLSLMNVSHVLSLRSLIGDMLQLVVVNMKIFTTNTGDLVSTGDAYQTLFDFCQWQNMTNPIAEADPRHHDIATLLSGRDIYGYHGNGTKGIALIGRACTREMQGLLVEFLNLDAIYATAHGIGRSLGMRQDGHHGNTCPEEGFLMCYHMQDNMETLGWSECSKSYLLNFLNSTVTCFKDVPGVNLIPVTN